MSNLKTIYRAYDIDTTRPGGAKAWEDLKTQLTSQGLRVFHAIGDFCDRRLDGREIELETKCLFENQWNTAPVGGVSETGLRVFDWAQDAIFRNGQELKTIKRGHYLEQTDEMREIRRNTNKCGYCGAQEPAAAGSVFHLDCLGSEYLTENDLHLLRMVPVCDERKRGNRPELTAAERAHLLPQFTDAQIHGRTERDKVRISEKRARLLQDREARIFNANTEYDGFTWLMDRGLKTDNVIFYNHTGRFCFGWRTPLDSGVLSFLLDQITEFPFPYDIKTADGRRLSGN